MNQTTAAATTTGHVVAEDGFGKIVHTHPFTGEAWTEETARVWRRKCAGSGRSGGRHIGIHLCACGMGENAPSMRVEDFAAAMAPVA